MKKQISRLLLLVLLFSLVPPAGASAFSDIPDVRTRASAEALRMLGVLEGFPDGSFRPDGTLTRAQFCKMAVMLSGQGGAAAAYKSYTIFPDVKSSHWAAGYINLAVRGEDRFISGYPEGVFRPEEEITWGQAVTILMRLLGYKDTDVGALWPDGHLAAAAENGLTETLNPVGGKAITRGQAAILFYNMLSTCIKDTQSSYLSKIADSLDENAVLLSVSATAADGSKNAVETAGGVYRTASGGALSAELVGRRGTLALDTAGRVMTFLPSENRSYRSVVVSSCGATYIRLSDNVRLDIPHDAPVYTTDDGETSYDKLWTNLSAGRQVLICYDAAEKVEYIFVSGIEPETAMVAKTPFSGNPFVKLTGTVSGFTIYKNGVLSEVGDLRRYDVATYDKASRVLSVSDNRITGILESVYPNLETPVRVTVLGHEFTVLDSAVPDIGALKLGDSVTLLLTTDGRVAGAVSSAAVRGVSVGIATEVSTSSATVELLNGMTVTGKTSLSADEAARLLGQLVTVGATKAGVISVTRLSSNNAPGAFDAAKKTVGGAALSPNARLFDQAGGSALCAITTDDIGVASVGSARIKYAARDYAGRISILVLDDVTGNSYTYGICTGAALGSGTSISNDPDGLLSPGENQGMGFVRITNGDGEHAFSTNAPGYMYDEFYGVAGGPGGRVAATATLSRIFGAPRSAFSGNAEDGFLYSTNNFTMPVAADVQCYIKSGNTWVDFSAMRAFSDSVTVYYDRTPETGGKVRLIVA